MILKVIFGQRKERYEGEFAPEALDVVTEFGYEENPDWLNDKLERLRKELKEDFKRFEIVDVEVSMKAIQAILRPSLDIVQGKVLPPNEEN